MDLRSLIAIGALLAASPDVHDLARFRASLVDAPDVSVLSASSTSGNSSAEVFLAVPPGGSAPSQKVNSSQPLQEQSRLSIIRYVDGEFAKVVQPLPGGKKGFKIEAGKPVDKNDLSNQLRFNGTSANPGDTVQITKIEFRSKEILFQINGGGKKKFHWREHVSVGMGPDEPMQQPVSTDPNEGHGCTIILDFGHDVPDMSPDDVKKSLSVMLDFTKEHSAAVNWVETLPPQFKQAIQDHHALVGMDDEMVVAAIGRPDRKVRQRDPSTGDETEDWIYGHPPSKTTFVTFEHDKVIKVEEFN
jgi:hypothetical protein